MGCFGKVFEIRFNFTLQEKLFYPIRIMLADIYRCSLIFDKLNDHTSIDNN